MSMRVILMTDTNKSDDEEGLQVNNLIQVLLCENVCLVDFIFIECFTYIVLFVDLLGA